MKRKLVWVWVGLLGTMIFPPFVGGEVYSNTCILEKQLLDFFPRFRLKYGWYHENPSEITGGGPLTPAEYDAAARAGLVEDVTLTIQVDDLDSNDWVEVWLLPAGGTTWQMDGEPLGRLNTMTFTDGFGLVPGAGQYRPGHMTSTQFHLDPCWLDGLPVQVALSGNLLNWNNLELEKSTLTVTLGTVPAPAGLVLGLAGFAVGTVGWSIRSRRAGRK